MKINTAGLLFLILLGCSSQPMEDSDFPEIGQQYDSARNQLLASGWIPVHAICSPNNVCFGSKYPEMASDMTTGKVCPVFNKSSSKLTVCLEIMPDGAAVESFSFGR